MKPFFLFLVRAEERGLCAGFVCKAANLRARPQQSTARPRPRPVGFATWKFDVGISRGYLFFYFLFFWVAKFCILATKSQKASATHTADFWGKILAQSRQIWTKRIWKRHIYTKGSSISPKNSEIARFWQKLPACGQNFNFWNRQI